MNEAPGSDGSSSRLAAVRKAFNTFAAHTARLTGAPGTFATACALIVIWAVTGPLFNYSDAWQLTINTLTTIITFLMVFVIQNSQNRDGAAVQIKLDELIRATSVARNSLLDLEDLNDEELASLLENYREIARHARDPNVTEIEETGTPEIAPIPVSDRKEDLQGTASQARRLLETARAVSHAAARAKGQGSPREGLLQQGRELAMADKEKGSKKGGESKGSQTSHSSGGSDKKSSGKK